MGCCVLGNTEIGDSLGSQAQMGRPWEALLRPPETKRLAVYNLKPRFPRFSQCLHRLAQSIDPSELLLRLRGKPAITLHRQVDLAVAHPGAHNRHRDPALEASDGEQVTQGMPPHGVA